MTFSHSVHLLALLSAVLIAIPVWVALGGVRHREQEGRADGIMALCGYVLTLFASFLLVIAGFRALELRWIRTHWRPVQAELLRCTPLSHPAGWNLRVVFLRE